MVLRRTTPSCSCHKKLQSRAEILKSSSCEHFIATELNTLKLTALRLHFAMMHVLLPPLARKPHLLVEGGHARLKMPEAPNRRAAEALNCKPQLCKSTWLPGPPSFRLLKIPRGSEGEASQKNCDQGRCARLAPPPRHRGLPLQCHRMPLQGLTAQPRPKSERSHKVDRLSEQ